MTTTIHDTETCDTANGSPCEMCIWANEADRRTGKQMSAISRRDAINQQRRNLIDEIDRMQAEVNRLDEEYDALDGEDDNR